MNYKIEGIQRPDLKLPDTWASVHQTYIDWLRQIGPQMGIDTPKAILGNMLGTIYGDDGNCFGVSFFADLMDQAKRDLHIRMDIEINTPELPEQIRNRITLIRSRVLAIDWSTEQGYRQAKNMWKKNVANFVQHELAMHKEYREAETYYLSLASQLGPHWQNFLHGSHIE